MSYIFKTQLAGRFNYGLSRKVSNIRYIVIHYTANDGDKATNNGNYFARNKVGASAHYFVDDTTVLQSVPDNFVAWHCGGSKYYHASCRNANSIGIEMCDTVRNGVHDVSQKTLQNTIELTRVLMKKYNIPISNVVRHYDVTHKLCPLFFAKDQNAWNNFKKTVASGGSITTSTPSSTTTTGGSNMYIRNGLNYRLVFDPVYYGNNNPDLAIFKGNEVALFNHFITYGINEGRKAISTFHITAYKNKNPDLKNAFGNNNEMYIIHYITNGIKEKRVCV